MNEPEWLTKARAEGRILSETGVRPHPLSCHINQDELRGGVEADFQQQVIDYASSLGYKVAHFRTVRIARADGSTHYATPVQADGAGFPDLILVGHGKLFAWELKVGRNKPTEEQLAWIAAFRPVATDAGVYYPADWERMKEMLTSSSARKSERPSRESKAD